MLFFEISKQTKITISNKWITEITTEFNSARKLKGRWYYSLAFVDNKTIKHLNKTYRSKDKITDVLSFEDNLKNFIDSPSDQKYLGEIVICVPQAKIQAQEIKCSFSNEIARLLIHGLAHLSGFDHDNVSDKIALKMLRFEKKILIKLQIWDIFKFEEDPINNSRGH